MKRTLKPLLFSALLVGFFPLLASQPAHRQLHAGAAQAKDDAAKPKLIVLLVVDQLRADYLEKWQDLFGEGGFKRLMEEGAWYTNCHYPYSDTLTAAGHASLVTGCSPNKHGIIANEWYDRVSGENVTAIESERYEILFTPEPPRKKDDKKDDSKNDDKKENTTPPKKPAGASPLRRREESIGDVLFRLTQGRSKIVSISIKDRAALMMAALRAQFVYWFSSSHGGFVTSNYYNEETLHSWVHDFNKTKMADQWFGKEWSLLKPAPFDYVKHSGADDVKAEGTGYDQGRTFPHLLKGGLEKPGKAYYEAVSNSPYGNDLLLAFAKTALDAEKLGHNEVTDMLCMSFSSNDLVGHCWGPDSQEVLDMTLRTDLILKDLFETLDTKVGKGKYLVVLSADHGVCPIPEVAKAHGKDAGRIAPEILKGRAAAFLQEKFARDKDKLPWIEEASGSWIYLNKGVLRSAGVTSAEVEKALASWLLEQPGVQASFTRTQLMGKDKTADPLVDSVRLSFHPEASGDVKVLFKPHYLFATGSRSAAYATTHGSPHPYDTHVPLLIYGPGVKKGVRGERITPQAATPIIAHSLRLPLPTAADAPLPKGLFVD